MKSSVVFRSRWLLLFLGFLLLSAFLYRHTVHSKFIMDWNTWMLHYLDKDWSGLASAYGDNAMRWGYHLSNMVLWKLFGFSAYGWFFSFTALHALNALLLTVVLHRLLSSLGMERTMMISLTAGTLWLVSPYHSETVVWGATVLYLVSTALILAGILCFISYAKRSPSERPPEPRSRAGSASRAGNPVHLALSFTCFLAALFTHESAITFPLLLVVTWLLLKRSVGFLMSAKRFVFTFFLPMMILVGLYFVANKLRVDSWVGHYGEASHLNADLSLIVPNLSKYLLKLLYAPLFFSFRDRDDLYAFLESDPAVWIQLVIWLVIAAFVVWKLLRGNSKWKLTAGFLVLTVVALLPVINLYFMYFKDIEQDRYVYWPSMPFYAALVVGLFFTLKRFAIVPVACCFLVSLYFLNRHTNSWALSGHISNSLLDDFRWQDANRVFVLLTPDNVNGAYCMRSMPNSTLSEMLRVRRDIDMDDKLFEVYQWNVVTDSDSAHCAVIDSNTLQLDLLAPGAWFWRNSFGASDHETELFDAKLNPHYPSFTVTFKDKQPGDVFIYAVNDRWEEVAF